METIDFFANIRSRLLEKRQNLTTWLRAASPQQRELRLGPATEQEVRSCLHDLDAAIAKAGDATLGICRVCHDHVNGRLLMMDYTACVCLDHYTSEERRQLEWELELSQVVQRALLPQDIPEIPGLELAAFSRPAQIVGGDYFDFFQYRDGAHGVIIADVAGHGISAGLLMASVQTALRTLAPLHSDPGQIVHQLNRFFCHNVHFTTFVTMFVGRLEPNGRTLSYVNAGHNPPLVLRAKPNGEPLTWLRPTAAAIGLVEEMDFRPSNTALSPRDLFLFYTDGVTEAADGDGAEFGTQRVAQYVTQHAGQPAQDLVAGLYREIVAFTGGHQLADDATVIAGRIVGLPQAA